MASLAFLDLTFFVTWLPQMGNPGRCVTLWQPGRSEVPALHLHPRNGLRISNPATFCPHCISSEYNNSAPDASALARMWLSQKTVAGRFRQLGGAQDIVNVYIAGYVRFAPRAALLQALKMPSTFASRATHASWARTISRACAEAIGRCCFRIASTRNSCRTCGLSSPHLPSQRAASNAAATACLPPA